MMNQQERDEKIELYGKGFDLLLESLKDIPREMWKFKPEPKEWSVHEVLVHLADSESNAALRARKLIVEPGGSIEMAATSWSATTAGDRRQLRGIPAVSRNVGGVSPGTDPVAELMRKQPR